MASYTAETIWSRGDQTFTDNRYSRRYVVRFDGGVELPGSASPHIVPLPYSAEDAVDPEETFVAALSGCHMLWFLFVAAKRGFVVDSYRDRAEGRMESDAAGRLWMSVVTLRPKVVFSGDKQPNFSILETLHNKAHEECFIANSVKTEVRCEPQP
jgi:organic hydroperoxide reductase OsmC/OhrA